MRRLVIALIGLFFVGMPAPAVTARADAAVGVYEVEGVRTALDRAAVAATGAAIVEVDHASVVVTASPADLRRLERLHYGVRAHSVPDREAARAGFPAPDSGSGVSLISALRGHL